MKIRNFIFGISLVSAICFSSCSDGSSSSDSNDAENTTSAKVLDLRIKKNGVVYNSSRSIENAAEITQTDHVKATAVSGGIQFEIALPSDASYLEIRRLEDIEGMEDFWTTRCELQDAWQYKGQTYKFVYPLCEPGEKYKFNIGIETTTINNVTTTLPEEIIIITATDGIGDIDYSNLKSRHIDLSYDGTKPTVKVLNVIPPEGDNVGTRIAYYAKNSSTETDWNNDVIWFGNYFGKNQTQYLQLNFMKQKTILIQKNLFTVQKQKTKSFWQKASAIFLKAQTNLIFSCSTHTLLKLMKWNIQNATSGEPQS